MIDESDSDDFQKSARIEARQFARLFRTYDGKAVLEAIKRDIGWHEATPIPDKDGIISTERVRDWLGARAAVGMILQKISLGNKLSEDQNKQPP